MEFDQINVSKFNSRGNLTSQEVNADFFEKREFPRALMSWNEIPLWYRRGEYTQIRKHIQLIIFHGSRCV